MKYTVNVGSPVLRWLGVPVLPMALATQILPAEYQWIVLVLLAAIGVAYFALLLRIAWGNQTLTIRHDELVLPRQVIHAGDIKYLRVCAESPAFVVYFVGRSLPIQVGFHAGQEGEAQAELRQWAWRNLVSIEVKSADWRLRYHNG